VIKVENQFHCCKFKSVITFRLSHTQHKILSLNYSVIQEFPCFVVQIAEPCVQMLCATQELQTLLGQFDMQACRAAQY
jgi:hypothetical protein